MFELIISLASVVATQTQPLSEQEAVGLGQQRPAIVTQRDGRARGAAGTQAAAGRWANPEVEISREQVDVPDGDATDQFFWVRQQFDISGARGLTRRAGAAQADAMNVRQVEQDRHLDRSVRQAFYAALAADRRHAALANWREGTETLRDAVAARVAEGDASRFDLLRLEREFGWVTAQLRKSDAERQQNHTLLFSLLASVNRPLTGELLPPETQPPIFDPTQHPAIQAFQFESDRAHLTAEAARRQRWPQLTLGLGHLRSQAPGYRGDGPLIALELEVPIFQRGNVEHAIAIAAFDVARSEQAITAARLQANYDAAAHALATQHAAATELASSADDELLNIAQAAYRGGEIGVAELLDAYESNAEASLLEIDLALAARRSWIDLQYLTGE